MGAATKNGKLQKLGKVGRGNGWQENSKYLDLSIKQKSFPASL